MAENIRIIWTDTETKEEKEVYSINTSLAGLWHLKEMISNEMKKAAGYQIQEGYHYLAQLEHLKLSAILLVLSECRWNKAEAAKKLGIQRTTLHEIINRYSAKENMPITDLLNHNYIDSLLGHLSDALVKAEMELVTKREISRARELALHLHKKLSQKEREFDERVSNKNAGINGL